MSRIAVPYADIGARSVVVPAAQSTRPSLVSFISLSSLPSHAPQLFLFGRIAPTWVIVQPLLVTLEQDEDGYYIVSDDEFAVYGDGNSLNGALEDYKVSLIDYYQLLAARAKGDPPTLALLRRLRRYLCPTAN